MNLQFYVEKFEGAEEFESFKKKYPDAYLFAGFFVFDLESGREEQKIDFFSPSIKKAITIDLNNDFKMQESELVGNVTPKLINGESVIDLKELEEIVYAELERRELKKSIIKIISIYHPSGDKNVWSLNVVLKNLEVLKVEIADESKEILFFEKRNLLEFAKKF